MVDLVVKRAEAGAVGALCIERRECGGDLADSAGRRMTDGRSRRGSEDVLAIVTGTKAIEEKASVGGGFVADSDQADSLIV